MSGKPGPFDPIREAGQAIADFGREMGWRAPTQPTAYAAEMIPKIRAEAAEQRRRGQRVTRRSLATALATAAPLDRETLTSWIDRGWLEWPPGDP